MDEFDLERELGLKKPEERQRPERPEPLRAIRRELEEDELGRIAISSELSLGLTDHKIEMYVPEERRDRVAVGEYVVIPCDYAGGKIFARIKRLSYRKRDALDDMSEVHLLVGAERVGEEEYIELAELEPISMIVRGRALEVRHIPKPNTIVRRVESEDEVKVGLDLPEDGLFLGYVAVNGEPIRLSGGLQIPYYLRNDPKKTGDPLIFTHTLIAGMSGRGKTHVAKNFLRQLVGSRYRMERRGGEEREVNLIVLDPHNEYWQMMEDNPALTDLPARELDALRAQGIKFGGLEGLRVFAAKEGERSYQGAPKYTEFTIPFSLVRHFPYLIAGGEVNEEQFEALTLLVRDFFSGGGERYREFVEFVDSEETLERYRGGRIHSETLKALRRRVTRPHFAKIFDQGPNPITQIYEEIFAEGAVSVFPTDHLSAEAERVVILALMSMVAEAKTKAVEADWGRRIAKFPLVLVVDEAHSYLTNAETQQDKIIVEKFVAAAKQGRKNRLGLVLITQNPQDVNGEVLSQVSTRILLGMEEGLAERAGAPKEYQKTLPYFERGRMVVHSPENSHPLELRGLEFCLVRH
ncbi:TPA: ATP-binding protein [Candidatus Bipolaricaulota bacterium]|nr:ATP-binding protein [Candidatus Bipolaricaulota bacterium]